MSVRVELPQHLRTLAGVSGHEVELEVAGTVTPRAVCDALEARFPMLLGTVRDRQTGQRRAFLRFFASGQDYSHLGMDVELPREVANGAEPLLIVGAVAGG